MSDPEKRLKEFGIELPNPPVPIGSYVPAVRSGKLLFLSGILPLKEGVPFITGKVGSDVSTDDARNAARLTAINALSVLKDAAGGLLNVARCIKITGYIASSTDFIGQPAVLNGASDLIKDVFGDAGRHARVAVGVPVLPLDSPVEIDFIFELR